ncbi:MAG: hypothetical protein JNJ40_11955 [Bacteroidia bacterium]|nr:hypothetical protein [Bacteroidia bacterium]
MAIYRYISIVSFFCLFTSFINSDISLKPRFVKINDKVINKLSEKHWSLEHSEVVLGSETKSYIVSYPTNYETPYFLKNGKFFNSLSNIIKIDSCKDINHCGEWSYTAKSLIITLEKNQPPETSFFGEVFIKSITDTTVVFQKNIARDGTWAKIYFFNKYKNE